MLFLLGGVVILGGLLLLGYLFVNADPRKLARNFKWIGLGLGVALVAALILTERFSLLWLPLMIGLPMWRRLRSLWNGIRGPTVGSSSDVTTPFLRMSLDHDTGSMTGTVLRGQFVGARVEELRRSDLIALLRECRTEDEEGARLIEAYLDRVDPGWRDDLGGAGSGAGDGRTRRPGSSQDMTADQAHEILGLAPGADAAAIKEAHHRLMKQLHPDHGGTDYLASQINRARDVLLRQR